MDNNALHPPHRTRRGADDRLEDALGKLGVADTVINDTMFTQDFVPGSKAHECAQRRLSKPDCC